jgi:hypothetical protein
MTLPSDALAGYLPLFSWRVTVASTFRRRFSPTAGGLSSGLIHHHMYQQLVHPPSTGSIACTASLSARASPALGRHTKEMCLRDVSRTCRMHQMWTSVLFSRRLTSKATGLVGGLS